MLIVHPLEVIVLESRVISNPNATVVLKSENKSETCAKYDPLRELYYFAEKIAPGHYSVVVCVKGLKTETRSVQVHPRPTREIFTMVPPGASYFYQGKNRIAYERQPEFVGAILNFDEVKTEQLLKDLERIPGLESVYYSVPGSHLQRVDLSEIQSLAATDQGHNISLEAIVVRRERPEDITFSIRNASLLDHSFVSYAGPIARLGENSLAIFVDEIIIGFHPEVSLEKRLKFFKDFSLQLKTNSANGQAEESKLELEIVHEINHLPNGVLVRLSESVDDTVINKIVQSIVDPEEDTDQELNLVDFAEPVIVELSNPDAVNPNDYLWPGSWDRKQVGVENAWCHLSTTKSIPAFGSPDLIIGIVDELPSKDGIVQHPDLNGKVSNQNDKIYSLYDFKRMKPNHNSAIGSHGLGMASVAAALSQTGGPKKSGGTSGVAPNVQLVGAIPPHRKERGSMLKWLAGLDVGFSRNPVPPPLETGCHIICWAETLDRNGLPAGSAQEVLKHLTRRGRKGKGCLIFFSAGNENQDNFKASSWRNSQFSLACAASTLNSDGEEVRAEYSNHSKYGCI